MDASLLLMMTAFHAARVSAARRAPGAWRPPAARAHGGFRNGIGAIADVLHECCAGAVLAGAMMAASRLPARGARSAWIRALDEIGLVPQGHLRARSD